LKALRFKELYIENFQSFIGEHTFNLDQPGLIYVTGDNQVEPELTSNGVGKSTIFNALCWTLYGRTLRVARPGAAVECWYGVDTVNTMVIFERGGKEYVLGRMRNPNSIVMNDEVVTQGKVNEAIGLSYEAFCNCIVVGQFNDLFLMKGAEEQTSLFTELLYLDIWLLGVKAASDKARAAEQALIVADNTLARHEGSLEELEKHITLTCMAKKEWIEEHDIDLVSLRRAWADRGNELRDTLRSRPEARDAAETDRARQLAQNNLSALEALRTRRTAARTGHQRDAAKVTAQIDQAERRIRIYNASKGTCPDCGQAVTQAHINKKTATLRAELDTLEDKLDDIEAYVEGLDEDIKETSDNISNVLIGLGLLNEQVDKANREQARFDLNLTKLRAQVDLAKKEYENCKQATNPYIKQLDNDLLRRTELEKTIEETQATCTRLSKEVSDHRFWADAYKAIRLTLIDETLSDLEVAVTKHAEALGLLGWRIQFETERETAKGDIRNKFTTHLYPPEADSSIPLESLSGGEIQRWNLACTFGLSEVLLSRAGISCNLLVLDEPTHHMSEAGVTALLEYLGEILKSEDKTIFFIDHHSLDKGSFSNVLHITKTEAGSAASWS